MKSTTILLFAVLFLLLCACEGIIENQDIVEDRETQHYGTINFEFPLTDQYGAGVCTRRIDLSISYSADSLYKEKYLTSANLSDRVNSYSFILRPGKYYYQAGKICMCRGDTCLWNGYPGGQNGTFWTMGWFEITEGSQLVEHIAFKK